MDTLTLSAPSMELVDSYLDFISEMKFHGEKVWESMHPTEEETPQDFIHRLGREREGHGPNGVAESIFWGIQNNQVVGRIALRHELTESLKEFGGNVGYEVRPLARNKGIAKEMLRKLLEIPEAKSLGELLVTCSPDNIASNKTIIANGGILIKTAFVEKWNRNTNYYSIKL